ncbi:MAG: helicase-related protein, partial [Chthoniobacteraceae bacterium]
LGLGIILRAEFGRVEVFFPAAGEQRQYALESAPLRRVQFAAGDRIKSRQGRELLVGTVEDRAGLLVYGTDQGELPEADLSDAISFSKPEDRLFGGRVDEVDAFELRVEALRWRSALRRSPVRGFVGGRVDLLPHQMYIASEIAGRLVPRVLLADEVGLGKTIEAGLILHRLHLTGRAERILILVPEPLVNQWFVEMLRRFNLLFSIFDEERCASIQLHDPEANPFLDSQLVLCSTALLSGITARAKQVVAAGWDLLVVDEAHHMEWSPAETSAQYSIVDELARTAPGVLLLTATPQQLGPEGHFARLRLLDPSRYADLAKFLEEAEHYEQVARALDRLLANHPLTEADRKLFGGHSPRVRRHCEELAAGDEASRLHLVTELLDAFGTGRVMFRNTRASLTGFPKRKALLSRLPEDADETAAKVKWIVGLLRELGGEKVLLICRTRALVEEIAERLQREIKVNCGVFHEGLTLLQRDRNAAYFAEQEGARILLCSEIGSEGRNFQFAHHLVLFDLPANPELLEQRIGRLDRIGQTAVIHIHVPYVPDSASEVLARWYHEGLNAFETHPHGAVEIAAALGGELEDLCAKFSAKKLPAFIKRTRELHTRVAKKLERGHDRLLELNSSKPERAADLIRQIRAADADASFEDFSIRLLDHFGVEVDDLSSRTYGLKPGHLITDAFPALPQEGLSVTFDRTRALTREDIGLFSGDHPLVTGALDLLLGSESGNTAFGVWKDSGSEAILLEVHFVIECVAPSSLHADRFLSPTPLRVVIDHAQGDRSDDEELRSARLEKGDIYRLLDRGAVKRKLLPAMLAKAGASAAERMQTIVESATRAMETQLQDEIERLETLRTINDHVRPEEIDGMKAQMTALEEA